MSETARQTAYQALMRVERDHAYSNLTLDAALGKSGLSARDKAFASALFYGVLEHQMLLDYNIAIRSQRPLPSLDPAVTVLLRLGLYQLYFADGVRNAAAVHETVALCKTNHLPEAAGFVNAVLRSAAKEEKPRLPDPKKGKNKYYAVRYSCSEEIVRLWRSSYGEELTLGLLSSLAGRPPLCVRVNTLRTTAGALQERLQQEGVGVQAPEWPEDCLLLTHTGAVEQLAAYQEGLFHVQDLASQLCCRVLDPQAGESLLDVCSAPGGKSFTCAQRMRDQGRILACDLYEARLGLVQSGAQRLGIHIISTCPCDAAEWEAPFQADRVLCDVPCSGLGILRRKPELRYKPDPGVTALPEVQYRILCQASRFVKSGGTLVYSTCTLNPEENNRNAARFLREHEEYRPLKLPLPENFPRGLSEESYELTLFPSLHGTDGFYISLFQRK